MQVNICPRLIAKAVSNGACYVYNGGVGIASSKIPLGVYATRTYKKNDTIHILEGKLSSSPSRNSIHIGYDMHVTDEYGSFINHSFEPNIRIDFNRLIAIRDINVYDEITFNYNDSELELAEPFEDDGNLVVGNKR
jgi:hypothetical protein